MSRIYFHSEHDEAEVRGWERAYAGSLCNQLLAISLGLSSDRYETRQNPSPLRRVVSGYPRTAEIGKFADVAETWLYGGLSDAYFLVEGRDIDTFTVAVNTAFVMGSDPIKLLARLHGQCEIHAYVEGPNRAWLADIIEQGRASGIMRPESGWESVVTLLRSRDDGPVVTSYSVCEQFPNRQAAQWTPPDGDEDGDSWYDIPEAERWRMAIKGLRSGSMGKLLEILPETWNDYTFGSGVNGFAIRAYAELLSKQDG